MSRCGEIKKQEQKYYRPQRVQAYSKGKVVYPRNILTDLSFYQMVRLLVSEKDGLITTYNPTQLIDLLSLSSTCPSRVNQIEGKWQKCLSLWQIKFTFTLPTTIILLGSVRTVLQLKSNASKSVIVKRKEKIVHNICVNYISLGETSNWRNYDNVLQF